MEISYIVVREIQSMNCIKCNKPIPQERLDHFREYNKPCNTCVDCSEETKKTGVMIYKHKTGGEIQITESEEENKLFYRSKRRSTYNAALPLSSIGKTNPGKFSVKTGADNALKGKS